MRCCIYFKPLPISYISWLKPLPSSFIRKEKPFLFCCKVAFIYGIGPLAFTVLFKILYHHKNITALFFTNVQWCNFVRKVNNAVNTRALGIDWCIRLYVCGQFIQRIVFGVKRPNHFIRVIYQSPGCFTYFSMCFIACWFVLLPR